MKNGLKSWSIILTVSLVLIPTLICSGLFYFYLKGELENRRMIAFMNFEQLSLRFDRSFKEISNFSNENGSLRFDREPLAIFAKNSSKWSVYIGTMPEGFAFDKTSETHCAVQRVLGKSYLACPRLYSQVNYLGKPLSPGVYLTVWELNREDWSVFNGIQPSRIFLLDSKGLPVYQSDRDEPIASIIKKPIVQDFIKSPLAKSATTPYTEAGKSVLGFAMYLPESHLTLFAESPAALIFAPLWKPASYLMATLFFAAILLFILSRYFVMSLKDQIDIISASFRDFANGLQIPTQHRAQEFFPEFESLILAMNEGTHELKAKIEDSQRPKEFPSNNESEE